MNCIHRKHDAMLTRTTQVTHAVKDRVRRACLVLERRDLAKRRLLWDLGRSFCKQPLTANCIYIYSGTQFIIVVGAADCTQIYVYWFAVFCVLSFAMS